MPSRVLPNVGLEAFFNLGEDGWDDEMSLNLLKLSVLVQGAVDSKAAALPGAPANGDIVLLDETNVTNPNKIAVRDAGAWVYITPQEGWMIYNKGDDTFYRFEGAAWKRFGVNKRFASFQIVTTALAANEILGVVHPPIGETWTFAADFAGSSAKMISGGLAPTSAESLTVYKNAAAVGTIDIATDGTVSFSTTGDATVTLTGGADILRIVGPAAASSAVGFVFMLAATAVIS